MANDFQCTYWVGNTSQRVVGSEQKVCATFIRAENDEFVDRATWSAYDESLQMPTGPVLGRFDKR